MTSNAAAEPAGIAADMPSTCPPWCVADHGLHVGEEDWVHTSTPVTLTEGVRARVCMSIDPDTGVEDGPYVLIGGSELTPEETRAVGESLIRLAGVGGRPLTA